MKMKMKMNSSILPPHSHSPKIQEKEKKKELEEEVKEEMRGKMFYIEEKEEEDKEKSRDNRRVNGRSDFSFFKTGVSGGTVAYPRPIINDTEIRHDTILSSFYYLFYLF